MKVIAAYLLAVLGGNPNPSASDLKRILGSVGAEADDERIHLLLSEVKGKDITDLIACGREKLASVPSGGGGGVAVSAVAGGGGAAAPAAEAKKEEKVEEKEESDDFGDFGNDKGFAPPLVMLLVRSQPDPLCPPKIRRSPSTKPYPYYPPEIRRPPSTKPYPYYPLRPSDPDPERRPNSYPDPERGPNRKSELGSGIKSELGTGPFPVQNSGLPELPGFAANPPNLVLNPETQSLRCVHRERLRIHELCLKSSPNLGVVASEVRLLCDLEQPEPIWTVRHVGGAMRGAGAEQLSVLVRTMVQSKASKNVLRLLFYALGYKLDHELLRVGFAFHFQRGAQITVTVSSVNKMLKLHATDEAVPVTPGIQLVEVTAPASSENYTEVVAAVSSFCEYLAPLLHLSKPGVSTGVVPTAAAAAASLMSDGGVKSGRTEWVSKMFDLKELISCLSALNAGPTLATRFLLWFLYGLFTLVRTFADVFIPGLGLVLV
ncbi:mediator of RNA polymerase II transcription subunit [Actinidia rufa]|uniref:Mediator of RNA polymerase II transcription subunit n=1 Tax=Actinidia rufa TaxID=165716 RepID=A0A7J0GHS0_9ERIC|nr:mediator of RNA polymerase II transcription subunit [Actinidia rufa]